MRHLARPLLLTLAIAPAALLPAQQDEPPRPNLDGYVSKIDSQSRFEVDGRLVERTAKTAFDCTNLPLFPYNEGHDDLALGDHLLVFGKYDRRARALRANDICRQGWPTTRLSGEAVFDSLSANGQSIRADGRTLQITAKTQLHFEPPIQTAADARPGDWVRYTAQVQSDGSYLLQSLTLGPNLVSKQERHLRSLQPLEFVPPDPAARRDGQVKFAHLAHRDTLPSDPALLSRLERVGNSLIPAYQKALPPGDPNRIDFHFYALKGVRLRDCFTLPNGTIFVPNQVYERLPTDDQLAAVLATCVANLIEKGTILLAPKIEANKDVSWAGTAAGLVVPGLGVATAVGTTIYGEHLAERLREQSDRVSLDLLTAAGIAPSASPRAYELLEAKQPKPDAPISAHVEYLYRALAERDRQSPSPAPSPTPSPASQGNARR